MTEPKRQWRNLLPVYVSGAAKNGWCCIDCHRPFEHRQMPCRTFGRLLVHRLLSHRLVRFGRPTGVVCHVTHNTKPQFVWAQTSTQTWTATGTITIPRGPQRAGGAS